MATRRPKPAAAPSSKKPGARRGGGRAGEEWVGGLRTLPLYVQQAGGAFRPDFAAWVCPRGVLAASPTHPDEAERALLGLLLKALTHPLAGEAGRPASVRLSDARFAPGVAKALGAGVAVRVGPTPELDALAEHFVNHLDQEDPAPERDPWVGGDFDPDHVRGFFGATAGLFRAAPWAAAVDESTLVAVDAPDLGLDGACLSVVGGADGEAGFLLFDSVADVETMRRAMSTSDEEALARGPGVPVFSVSFEAGAGLPEATRAAVARGEWPLAGEEAYPLLVLVDADSVARPPTVADLVRGWALSAALARFAHDRRGDGPAPRVRATYVLDDVPGRPEVTLTALAGLEVDEADGATPASGRRSRAKASEGADEAEGSRAAKRPKSAGRAAKGSKAADRAAKGARATGASAKGAKAAPAKGAKAKAAPAKGAKAKAAPAKGAKAKGSKAAAPAAKGAKAARAAKGTKAAARSAKGSSKAERSAKGTTGAARLANGSKATRSAGGGSAKGREGVATSAKAPARKASGARPGGAKKGRR